MLLLQKRYTKFMRKITIVILLIFTASPLWAKVDYLRVMFNHNASHQATIGWCQSEGSEALNVKLSYKPFDNDSSHELIQLFEPTTTNEFKGLKNVFLRLSD